MKVVVTISKANAALQELLSGASGIQEVIAADTFREALEHLSRHRVGAIVADEQMPDVDAWRLTRMVRTGSFCPASTPIVVLRDIVTGETLARAKDYGIVAHRADALSELPAIIAEVRQSTWRPRVLIIEDQATVAEIARATLANDYEVEIAKDGVSGLVTWRESEFDLVLLDMVLPGMSGQEVLEAMMRERPTQPVIIVSADATRDRQMGTMLAGAHDFITKPYNPRDLREACARVLRYSEPRNQRRRSPLPNLRQLAADLWAAHHAMVRGEEDAALTAIQSALEQLSTAPPDDDFWLALTTRDQSA